MTHYIHRNNNSNDLGLQKQQGVKVNARTFVKCWKSGREPVKLESRGSFNNEGKISRFSNESKLNKIQWNCHLGWKGRQTTCTVQLRSRAVVGKHQSGSYPCPCFSLSAKYYKYKLRKELTDLQAKVKKYRKHRYLRLWNLRGDGWDLWEWELKFCLAKPQRFCGFLQQQICHN